MDVDCYRDENDCLLLCLYCFRHVTQLFVNTGLSVVCVDFFFGASSLNPSCKKYVDTLGFNIFALQALQQLSVEIRWLMNHKCLTWHNLIIHTVQLFIKLFQFQLLDFYAQCGGETMAIIRNGRCDCYMFVHYRRFSLFIQLATFISSSASLLGETHLYRKEF